MIDEEKTFDMFGYYSDSLSHGSHKKVVGICNDCRKERILVFQDYKDLCVSCCRSGKRHHMFEKMHLEETKQKISKANSGKNNPHYGRIGDKHPNWNPNLTDEDRQDKRKYPEYKEWRRAVFERDSYTCQICGQISGSLVAHHLEGYANNPELRIILSNGITICKEHHNNFHHQYGYNNTKEQYEEYSEQHRKT